MRARSLHRSRLALRDLVLFRNNSEVSDYSQQGKASLRLYQPFALYSGRRLTKREDIRGIDTNQTGQDNRSGQWRSNIGDIFVQATLATPEMAPGLKANLGLRVEFPTGGLKPFGDGRYQVAPHFGLDSTLPGSASFMTFSPLARYFQTFGDMPPHGTDISQIHFYPTVKVRLGPRR